MSTEESDSRYPWRRITRRVKVLDGSEPDFDYSLVPFDDKSPPPAGDIAALHSEILPTSPAYKLGRRFLEDFYYTVLPRDGHIFGNIAYINTKPVAFWVGTEDSNGFMEKAQRAHPFRLALVLALTILLNPASFGAMIETRQLMNARAPSSEMVGEALSHGVLDKYRHREFKSKTGIHIARDTSNMGMVEFVRRGVTSVKAVIDQTNTRNRERNLRRGWKLIEPDAPGWKVPSVETWIDPRNIKADE